jgi:hypothetical protein
MMTLFQLRMSKKKKKKKSRKDRGTRAWVVRRKIRMRHLSNTNAGREIRR